MKQIILASTSPRRRDLMKILGVKFKVAPSDYEENLQLPLRPEKLAKVLSLGKAKAAARRYKNAIVIAADTFVVFNGKIMGKPKSKSDAKKMLKNLSGKINKVMTGLAIVDTQSGRKVLKVVETLVKFRSITDREIKNYIATGEPMDKAGAYAGQGLGGVFIERIEGNFFNMVGLPLADLVKELRKFGVKIL